MLKADQYKCILTAAVCLYLFSYAVARTTLFHQVERYAGEETLGVDAKGNPREDYIAKRNYAPGEGWEYQLFRPLIKTEEKVVNFFHNL